MSFIGSSNFLGGPPFAFAASVISAPDMEQIFKLKKRSWKYRFSLSLSLAHGCPTNFQKLFMLVKEVYNEFGVMYGHDILGTFPVNRLGLPRSLCSTVPRRPGSWETTINSSTRDSSSWQAACLGQKMQAYVNWMSLPLRTR